MESVDWYTHHISSSPIFMAVQIKLFHFVQKFNRLLYSFKLRVAIIISPLIISFLSKAAYFLFKTHTIAQFAQIFYISITELCITIEFVAMCWKMSDVEKFIEKFEEFIQKS